MTLFGFLFGGVGGKAMAVPRIVALLGPQASVQIAIVGTVLAYYAVKAVVSTIRTRPNISLSGPKQTLFIRSNSGHNQTNRDIKKNDGNKPVNSNAQTNTNTRSEETDSTGSTGGDGDDPKKPINNQNPKTTCRNLVETTEEAEDKNTKPIIQKHKKITKNVQDEDSEEIAQHTGKTHFVSRSVIHTPRIAGEIRIIVEKTGILFDELIKDGASTFKDAHIKGTPYNPDLHRAHVIRIIIIWQKLKELNFELYRILSTHAGHTQRVDKMFNQWGKSGGNFDLRQYGWIKLLFSVNFSAGPTAENLAIFETYRLQVIEFYDKEIGDEKNCEEAVEQLRKAKETMENTTSLKLFEKGLEGYKLQHKYENQKTSYETDQLYEPEASDEFEELYETKESDESEESEESLKSKESDESEESCETEESDYLLN